MEAQRESGESVSVEGDWSSLPRVIQDAYKIEKEKGTIPGEAAYIVTSSYLKNYERIYHDGMFGSWTVGTRGELPRIDYDGRDFYLMLSLDKDSYAWQGRIEDLSKGRCQYFERLVNLPTNPKG